MNVRSVSFVVMMIWGLCAYGSGRITLLSWECGRSGSFMLNCEWLIVNGEWLMRRPRERLANQSPFDNVLFAEHGQVELLRILPCGNLGGGVAEKHEGIMQILEARSIVVQIHLS